MGACGCSEIIEEEYPILESIKLDQEKEKLIKNKIGPINFKDLIMNSLSKEFLELFKKNENLFYAKSFLEGVCKEFGLMGRKQNIKEAYQIYKKGADFEYDYLCMYRLHRIFFLDYKKFNLQKNFELDRLYLYKCYAFIPFSILDRTYKILNKIDITGEINAYFDYLDDSKFSNLGNFIEFLKNNDKRFKVNINDINLMQYVIVSNFKSEVKENFECLNSFLELEKIENTNNNPYYEAQLKYCNFYIEFSGEKCDKEKVIKIFDK
jgi:hypothetical protein